VWPALLRGMAGAGARYDVRRCIERAAGIEDSEAATAPAGRMTAHVNAVTSDVELKAAAAARA
jgi:hypothetical protein